MKGSCLVKLFVSLIVFYFLPGITQTAGQSPAGRTRMSPALIAPDQPVSLSQINVRPSLAKDPLPRLNNSAITLSQSNKNGPALSLLERVRQGRPSDTVAYNRALVLIKLKRFDEAATELTKLASFGHAQLNLAALQCRMGNWESGLRTLQAAPATAEWADEKAVNIALVLYQLGKYDEAATALSRAGAGSTAQILQGDIALAKGRFVGALNIYNSLQNDEIYGRIIAVRIGNALLGQRQFSEAAHQFETYLESGDRTAYASARLGLANALYGQHEYSKAMAEYRAAVQLMPKSAAARTGLANTFASNHDYRSARTHYETALKQQPDNPNATLGLGVVAYRQGQFDESASHFSKIDKLLEPTNPDHADAFLHQGLMALSSSRYDTARRALEVATRLRPGDPSAFSGMSEVFRRQDLYGQALDMLQQSITKTASHHWPGATVPTPEMTSKTRARMLANQGSLLLKLNMLDKAYPIFKEALKDDPRNINALNGLAVSLLETDQLEKANSLYDSILSRGNHKAFLHNNRGIVRAYAAMQLDKKKQPQQARQLYLKAKTDYEQAQAIDTTRRFYQNNLGNVLKNLDQYEEAIKSYQAYLSKSAINNMGVLYAASGKPDFSRYYLNLAIELDSTNLVYHYNRVKLYRQAFADSLARKPNLLAAERRLPTNSISAKYSRDGYINIYLYDYDFDAYDFPADHHFPVKPEKPQAPDLLPVDDFVMMPEPIPTAPVATPPVVVSRPSAITPATNASVTSSAPPAPVTSSSAPYKRGRMPKPARPGRTSRWGSTRCPTF